MRTKIPGPEDMIRELVSTAKRDDREITKREVQFIVDTLNVGMAKELLKIGRLGKRDIPSDLDYLFSWEPYTWKLVSAELATEDDAPLFSERRTIRLTREGRKVYTRLITRRLSEFMRDDIR